MKQKSNSKALAFNHGALFQLEVGKAQQQEGGRAGKMPSAPIRSVA